ncbi:unnamed protein product [Spirodela intermedia]|uniref:Uncharacterized protein n=1 Tax=Spirodela intermedia TaxID=51605 RepID=A0A7I8KM66_SPIIN|nr:unnamed protein product [Spirodela intermedia]
MTPYSWIILTHMFSKRGPIMKNPSGEKSENSGS